MAALRLLLTLATLAEKLIPLASRLVDAYIEERTRRQAAAEQAAKDQRNEAAIAAARSKVLPP
jgi:hypothetical protein